MLLVFFCRRRRRRGLGWRLREGPALERLDPKVFVGAERLVGERLARLRPALVQVAVEPQSEATAAQQDEKTIDFVLFSSFFFGGRKEKEEE